MSNNPQIIKTAEITSEKYNEFTTEDKALKLIIAYFINGLEEKIGKENLKLALNNIGTLKIENKTVLDFLSFDEVTYDTIENKISIFPLKDKTILKKYIGFTLKEYIANLYHELLHMSSTLIDKKNNKIFSGFTQMEISGTEKIGVAIDEGYTEVLTYRLFDLNKKYMSYSYEVAISKLIEKIISKEKMMSLYFNANLYNLVEELQKYNNKENIEEFIKTFDKIYILRDHSLMFKKSITDCHYKISSFLIETYLNKLETDLKEEKISVNEYKIKIQKYLKKILKAFQKLELKNTSKTEEQVRLLKTISCLPRK